MFDIAFSELLVIAVVALVVIGPEKLPKVARTVGTLMGRLQRYVSAVKADVEREMRTEELRQVQSEIQQGVSAVASAVSQEVAHGAQQLQSPVREAVQAVDAAAGPDSPSGPA